MQKKDLKIHMIKVHGAPKPHAVSDSNAYNLVGNIIMPCYWKLNKIWFFFLITVVLSVVSSSVHCVPSVSYPALSYVYTRQPNIVVRNCLCVRSAAIGLPAATACKCTSKPFTGKHMRWTTETCFIYCFDLLLIISVCYSKSRLLENARIMHACGEKTINNVNERKLDKKETFV